VCQTLYAITLRAVRARALIDRHHIQDVDHIIRDVLQLATTGQSELRALIADIRSDSTTAQGLTAALARLAEETRRGEGLEVRTMLAGEPDLPAASKEALAVITREALHNVVKHARAVHVDIVLEVEAHHVVLLIVDDGRGFDPAAPHPGHFGMHSMRERAAAIGGSFDVVSARGVGTHVRVCVPM
jgi:signal transduction histidine kinase